MEYQIEVSGQLTESLFRKLYRKVHALAIIIVLPIFFFAAFFAVFKMKQTGQPVYSIQAALYVLLATWYYRLPVQIAKRAYKTKLRYYNGELPNGTLQFGDQIRYEDVDSMNLFPYDKVKRVYFEQEGIILVVESGKVYGFPAQIWHKGSLSELKQLLRTKCPDLKIPE